MQLILNITKEQDLQVLLPLLERLKIAYKRLPAAQPDEDLQTVSEPKLSEKYGGKMSPEIGNALQKHLSESRNEWERNT